MELPGMECAEELRIDVRFSERLSNWKRLRKLTIFTSELQYGPVGKKYLDYGYKNPA